jgi:hypothetical protein
VGSIGTAGGQVYLDGASGDIGLFMGTNNLYPRKSAALADNAVDIGQSSYRFKDLYLSGDIAHKDAANNARLLYDKSENLLGNQGTNGSFFSIYLGGSAAANRMDDYEEGTWTGTLRGLSGEPGTLVTTTGYYVKIGRAVHWTIGFENINTTGYSGAAEVDGLPFQNAYGRSVGSAINYITLSFGTDLVTKIESSATTIDLMDSRDSLAWANAVHNAGTGRYLWMTGTYQTNA